MFALEDIIAVILVNRQNFVFKDKVIFILPLVYQSLYNQWYD